MLRFIEENQLIPYTTEQVIKWLDWYGFRVKINQDAEIWYYPHDQSSKWDYPHDQNEQDAEIWYESFQVDSMIKAASALVDFLFKYSHLFSTRVSGEEEDLLFTFVSKSKEEIVRRNGKRTRRIRKQKGIDSELATGGDSRSKTQTQEEADDVSIASTEVLRERLICFDCED